MLKSLQFAWRRLRRAPGFALAAILTLALAIGANTAIFSVADAVLFRPLPYQDPDSVFVLTNLDKTTGIAYTQVLMRDLEAIQDNLTPVGLLEPGPTLMAITPDGADPIRTVQTTPNYFDILGAQAARGRLLTASDATASGRPAVLTYASWQQRFGGDPSIVGRTVTLGQTNLDIVGVLPSGFILPSAFVSTTEVITLREPLRGEGGGTFHPIVRLPPGLTRDQLQERIEALMTPLHAGDPRTANMTPALTDARSVLFSLGRRLTGFLLAAAGLVLFIGCTNLAIMLLVRGHRAMRETGVRAALGATRFQLVLPVILESALIGLAGAVLALAITSLSWNFLLKQVPPTVYGGPGGAPIGIDLRVALFALALGLLGGVLFAVVPAWRSSRRDVQSLIHGREERIMRRERLGRPLVALQVALAVVLMFGALTVGRAFQALLNEPLGFDPHNVLTINVVPTTGTPLERQAFYVRAIETLAARSDVVSVGASSQLPMDGSGPFEFPRLPGSPPNARPGAGLNYALPGFFETAGIPLLRGRLLNWDDVRGTAEAAIVSEPAARALWPGQEALGQTFTNGAGRRLRVVGVVAGTKQTNTIEPPVFGIPAETTRFLRLMVHTRNHQDTTLNDIRRQVVQLAPTIPVRAQWWDDTIDALDTYRDPRFQTLVLATFAGLALGLTALGIFAIVAFSVVVRTREMGIRLAVGALPRSVVALMVRQALTPVVIGLLAGVFAAQWAGRIAEAQLSQLATRSPAGLAGAAAIVAGAALLAAFVPARRASQVDPASVLRAD